MDHPAIRVKSAADALDQIRLGGNHVVLIVNRRLADVREAVEKGHFSDALEAASSLCQKLGQLANAQQAMGLFADNAIVRVRELEEGMVIPGVGPITNIGPCLNCGRENCENIAFTVGENEQIIMDRDVEIVIEKL